MTICYQALSHTLFFSLAQVSLASDFMYNYMSREVTASFGYDYILRQVLFSNHILLTFMLLAVLPFIVCLCYEDDACQNLVLSLILAFFPPEL